MRHSALLLTFLLSVAAHAAEPAPEPSTQREVALDQLLSERDSPDAFATAIAAARKQGISEQAILEARFIFHVDREEDAAIAALLPEFTKIGGNFKLQDSEIFATKEDWLAVVEYVHAIAALRSGDKDGFKKHITEAFWLSPKQGTAFAPHIDRLRLAETMASVKIDFESTFKPLDGTQPVSLSKILGENKALLLQFWSPWSSECEATLPDFTNIAKELERHSVAVATIVLESSDKTLTDTREIIGPKPPGIWVIDHERNPLSPLLRIQTVPVVVLVTTDGKVLFNGSATSDELWTHLGKINSAIKQPAPAAPPGE